MLQHSCAWCAYYQSLCCCCRWYLQVMRFDVQESTPVTFVAATVDNALKAEYVREPTQLPATPSKTRQVRCVAQRQKRRCSRKSSGVTVFWLLMLQPLRQPRSTCHLCQHSMCQTRLFSPVTSDCYKLLQLTGWPSISPYFDLVCSLLQTNVYCVLV
jgi:hypothetical protein